ncbi:cytochrome C and Quinol oxidase polypeptide I [archaeon BMS3Bbin15]|nr:cytochrome C and Quinol oxidase polypeptide I [archaeon BMS3Bbin15]
MRKLLRLLPVRFFVASLVYLTLGVVFGALDALGYGNFKSVHAHLIAGAFFTLVIMGSMYQLIPTIIGTEIRYKRLAEIQFILVNIAFISLAYSFLIEYSFLKVAGFIAFVSFLIFAIEIYATTLNVKNFYKLSLAIWFFLAAVAYLIIGSAYALTGALGITGFNILEHAHILTIGFIAMTTFGGFYELFPMLALKKLYSRRLGEIHFFIANIAAIGMFLSFSQKGSLFIFSSIVFLLGFYLFAFNIAKTYLSKVNTPAPETDISARFMAYALIFGVAGVTAGLSSALTGFPGSFTHVHYILAGWVGLTMVGAMYHIVPMLTWIQKYSSKAGKEKVPLINELYNKQLAKAIFITMNISLALFGLRSFLPALNLFSVPLAAAFLAFAVEMVLILKR